MAPPDALLLALALAAPACVVSRSVGQEPDEQDSALTDAASGEVGGNDTTTTSGATSMTSMTSGTSTATSSSTTILDTGADGGSCTAGLSECAQCECNGGEKVSCDTSACVYQCAMQPCGTACLLCPDGQDDCVHQEFEGICSATGDCISGATPDEPNFCSGLIGPGFEQMLTDHHGCSDLFVHALDPEATIALTVRVHDNLVATANATGKASGAAYSLPSRSLHLEVRTGTGLDGDQCTDTPEIVTPTEVWFPIGGDVTIDVDPTGRPGPRPGGFAHVQLTDVLLQRDAPGPDLLLIESMMIPDVFVGWDPA